MESLREIFIKVFDLDLPISGGQGQSVEDPIVIDLEKDGVALEYKIIQLIHELGGKKYKIERQELINQGNRQIDKISVILDDEPYGVRNFYFDITKSF